MATKYQIWINSDLIGHITGNDVTIDDAIEYAIEWRGEIDPKDVEMCEIPRSYYTDIAQSTAKDTIDWM